MVSAAPERGGRGRGRGGKSDGGARGRGGGGSRAGRGSRRGFSGALAGSAAATSGLAESSSGSNAAYNAQVSPLQAQAQAQAQAQNGSSHEIGADDAHKQPETQPVPATVGTASTDDAEVCFICAEPIILYSVPQCNHRTCHVCAVRLRALYKKDDCTFCKAPSDALIFTQSATKNFLDFHPDDIPFRDERLNVHFETRQARDETLILLHFNCPDESCEYAGSNWADLRGHARSEHHRLFCDLCTRYSKIFVHEHALYTSTELAAHIREAHKHCEYCKLNFFSDDELYVHMRDRHEQCFICKRHEETRDEYQRDYAALERHFRKQHYLCESKECLDSKFVVFESEMDLKAHQVTEHGGELTSKEKRDALRVTANFSYNQNSAQARSGQSSGGSSGLTPRGRPRNDLPADESLRVNSDPLGLSVLASRNHVPGSGGPADHQSRRAMFGSQLSSRRDKKKTPEASTLGPDAEAAEVARVEKHQAYMARVDEMLDSSDAKMYAFRAQVKMYHGGETSASDLVDSVQSIVGNQGKALEIINGLVDLLEDREQKQDLMTAWSASQVEQAHFPSLAGGSGTASGGGSGMSRTYANANANLSSAQRGHVRSIKNSSSANNRSVWANVERAAGGVVPRTVNTGGAKGGLSSVGTTSAFPSLGGSIGSATRNSTVPGSAAHAAAKNVHARSKASTTTPWAGASAATRGPGNATPRPFSVDVAPSSQKSNQGSVRSNAAAFPSLPTNAAAVELAAQKRALFEHKRKQQQQPSSNNGTRTPLHEASIGASGTHTPHIWRPADFGRVDANTDSEGLGGHFNINVLAGRLHDAAALQSSPERHSGAAQPSTGSGAATPNGQKGRKQKQKQVLVTLGGVHRGG